MVTGQKDPASVTSRPFNECKGIGYMKVFISTDMEGVTGVTQWCEVTKGQDGYDVYKEQLTREVCAACEGALEAGATEIVVKDAHSTARNLIPRRLPPQARVISGWGTHPYFMMQGIDNSFDAAMMIGYHTMAGGSGNPLAHTISSERIAGIRINGHEFVSEFFLNTYTAALENVPVVMISGDKELCNGAPDLVPGITTVAVKEGFGGSTVNLHPDVAVDAIRAGAKKALETPLAAKAIDLPGHFSIQITYNRVSDAYEKAFYPGARLISARTIAFESPDWFEVLRMIVFVS